MELVLMAIVALIILGGVDKQLHPRKNRPTGANTKRAFRLAAGRKGKTRRQTQRHRHISPVAQPFLASDGSQRH